MLRMERKIQIIERITRRAVNSLRFARKCDFITEELSGISK